MKLYAYAAALLGLVALLAYGAHIKHRADQADAAEQSLADYKAAVTAQERQFAERQANAAARSQALAATLDKAQATITDLRNHPPKASVKYVQLPGEECPRTRLDPEWVSGYNAASVASGPVQPAH